MGRSRLLKEDFNNEKLKRMMKERNVTAKDLENNICESQAQTSRYINGIKKPSLPIYRIMKDIVFQCEDEDLCDSLTIAKPGVENASTIIGLDEIKESIENINKRIDTLNKDLSTTAKLLLEINRTVKEGKGQAELNHDSLESINNRITTVCNYSGQTLGMLKSMKDTKGKQERR